MTDLELEPEEERRVPDDEQPIALALAEEAGTLPDEDRRHEEEADATGASFAADYVPCAACHALDKAGIGTALDKQAHGWKLKMVDGGTVVLTEGRTISEALFGIVLSEPPAPPSVEEEAAPVPAPIFHSPVLKRGDGTPLQDVGGQLVVVE